MIHKILHSDSAFAVGIIFPILLGMGLYGWAVFTVASFLGAMK
jgi:hypothetical protein